MKSIPPLITASELRQTLDQWRIVDCSHDLEDVALGARQFADRHVPGAVHAHLDDVLSGAKLGYNGRHPLPTPQDLCTWLGKQGISPTSAVVAYDRSGGSYAARLWWLLKWLGHTGPVRVLDGGWRAWEQAGGQNAELETPPGSVHYPIALPRDELLVDLSTVERNLTSREMKVIDARGTPRYLGEVEPIDPRPGHIPGAINRPYLQNLDVDGCFKTPANLKSEWLELMGDWPLEHTIAQCGSGVTACHNLLALAHAGLPLSRLYPGSWSEWCSNPDRPACVGRE